VKVKHKAYQQHGPLFYFALKVSVSLTQGAEPAVRG
jgi:hypothetical protein